MAAYMLVEVAIHSPLLYEEYKKKKAKEIADYRKSKKETNN